MIKVVGLGPGHPSYVLPLAIEIIKSADLVVGAKRHLDPIMDYCKDTMDYSKGFGEIQKLLMNHKKEETIVFAVSGDVGFYSMLDFIKRNVEASLVSVVPGISSLQYFYSKLALGYEESSWISLHGRDYDLDDKIRKEEELGILLDHSQNNQYVACEFKRVREDLENKDRVKDTDQDIRRDENKTNGLKIPIFYVGERLSYDDEAISRLTMDECINYKAKDLSVVIVRYE